MYVLSNEQLEIVSGRGDGDGVTDEPGLDSGPESFLYEDNLNGFSSAEIMECSAAVIAAIAVIAAAAIRAAQQAYSDWLAANAVTVTCTSDGKCTVLVKKTI